MHSKYKAFHREVVFTLSPSRLMRFTRETLSSRKDFRMYSLHWEENVKWLSAGKHNCCPQTKLAQAQGPLLGEVVKTHLKFSFGKMSVRPPWKPWIRSVLPPSWGPNLENTGEKKITVFYWDVSHNCCSQGIRWHSDVNVAIEKPQQTSGGQCSAIASSLIRHLWPSEQTRMEGHPLWAKIPRGGLGVGRNGIAKWKTSPGQAYLHIRLKYNSSNVLWGKQIM